jgi:hypothetical protein
VNKNSYTDLFGHFRDEHVRFGAVQFRIGRLWSHWQRLRYVGKRRDRPIETVLAAKKKSDTLFIFGSGYSLNEMSEAEWANIARHNTMGFNWFVYQDFVDLDYHIIRETFYAKTVSQLKSVLDHYCSTIVANRRYADTSFLVQSEHKATSGNSILGLDLLPPHHDIALYKTKTRRLKAMPSMRASRGVSHGPGTLVDCINFGILGGWKNICLAGVDLYDRRYFWLGYDQSSRGFTDDHQPLDFPHSTIGNGLIDMMGRWEPWCRQRGIALEIYNPRSLLSQVLPVYGGKP